MIRRRSVLALALSISAVLALGILAPASAQGPALNVKLGLWEATTTVQTSGAPPIDTSGMSPEQRARLEAAFANSRKRMAAPHTFRSCLTKEKLGEMPFQDRNNRACKPTVLSSSSSEYAVKFSCTDESGETTSGQWRFQAASPELVKGDGEMTMERGGQKMESKTSMTAKWIGASCGNVK